MMAWLCTDGLADTDWHPRGFWLFEEEWLVLLTPKRKPFTLSNCDTEFNEQDFAYSINARLTIRT